MSFAVKVNGKEVFTTDELVRNVEVQTAHGPATTVQCGDKTEIDLIVNTADLRNQPLDVVEEKARKARNREALKREKAESTPAVETPAPSVETPDGEENKNTPPPVTL